MTGDNHHSEMRVRTPQALLAVFCAVVGIAIIGFVLLDTSVTSSVAGWIKKNTEKNVDKNMLDALRPISATDHVFGDRNADVMLFEFADLECPFSKRFQEVMKQVMRDYGKDGRVAWVYRHFPNDALHTKARTEAMAAECAQEVGGGYAFFEYINRIFEITPSMDGLDLSLLPKVAEELGIPASYFQQCLESKKYKDRIALDLAEAERLGGKGTPYTILVTKDGRKTPIVGALSYEEVKKMIDTALSRQK